MFFPVDPEEWKKALGQIRRLRHRGGWLRIGASDAYWTSAFFAALVETVDSLLLEDPEHAYELSRHGIVLAERMRVEDCPEGNEMGKRSLEVWARAVYGSACRASERYEEAEDAFERATWLATQKPVFSWTAAEVDRRHAVLHLTRGSLLGFELVNRALHRYGGHSIGQANALAARAVYHQQIFGDSKQAALDLGQVLELIDPKKGADEARIWLAAIHNLNYVYAVGGSDFETLRLTVRRVRAVAKSLSKNEGHRRALCRWTEALLIASIGSTRNAKRLMFKAKSWLLKNRYFHAGALCAVDLTLLQLRDEEPIEAQATLAELERGLAAGGAAAASYLQFWIEHRLGEEVAEKSLVAFRSAILPLGQNLPGIFQPFGTIIGEYSGSTLPTG